MSQRYEKIPDNLQEFIHTQKIFFVATAGATTRVNLSPKGMDSLRILSATRVIWLNVTGSGNETSAHVQESPRMTLMFCAFEGRPLILRLYGTAKIIHSADTSWGSLVKHFPALPGARQIFDMEIDLVQTSCGMGVPLLDYREDRQQLSQWANQQGSAGIASYWKEKNQTSLDGKAIAFSNKS